MKELPLLREEWDFRACPNELLVHCFLYEYARESPYLQSRFKKEIERGANFPVFFHFHHHDFAGLNIHTIEAPLGYPSVPFLLLENYRPHLVYEKIMERPSVDSFELDEFTPRLAREQNPRLPYWHLGVRIWHRGKSKKQIAKDLLRLLDREMRNRGWTPPARDGKGRSAEKEAAYRLKALAALRLLKRFTVKQAADYIKKEANLQLFSKQPDWYEAKKRAQEQIGLLV